MQFIRLLDFIFPICVLFHHHKHQCVRETTTQQQRKRVEILLHKSKKTLLRTKRQNVHISPQQTFAYTPKSKYEFLTREILLIWRAPTTTATWTTAINQDLIRWKFSQYFFLFHFKTFNIIVIGAIVQQQNERSVCAIASSMSTREKDNVCAQYMQWHRRIVPKWNQKKEKKSNNQQTQNILSKIFDDAANILQLIVEMLWIYIIVVLNAFHFFACCFFTCSIRTHIHAITANIQILFAHHDTGTKLKVHRK